MSIEKARVVLDAQWNKHIGGLFGRATEITQAVEALAREVAEAVIARWESDALHEAMHGKLPPEIARASAGGGVRPCTCHPDDNPPRP